MEPTEKDIVIEKIMKMPEEQVAKVMIFIAGLEAGDPNRKAPDLSFQRLTGSDR